MIEVRPRSHSSFPSFASAARITSRTRRSIQWRVALQFEFRLPSPPPPPREPPSPNEPLSNLKFQISNFKFQIRPPHHLPAPPPSIFGIPYATTLVFDPAAGT